MLTYQGRPAPQGACLLEDNSGFLGGALSYVVYVCRIVYSNSYYPFNVCGVQNDCTPFNPHTDNLCLFLLFLSVFLEAFQFYWSFHIACFWVFWFPLYFSAFNFTDFCSLLFPFFCLLCLFCSFPSFLLWKLRLLTWDLDCILITIYSYKFL